MAMSITRIMIALEAEENVFSFPFRCLEVGGPDRVDAVARPDQIAVVAENIWPSLTWAMLLSGRVRVPCEWRHEKIPFLHIGRRRNGDVEARRRKVSTRFVLPIGSHGSQDTSRDDGALHLEWQDCHD
jgi:hypothetical protein